MPTAENSESRKSQLALVIARGASIAVWARKNDVPDRTAYRWATESKVRARIKAYRRRARDRAVGRLAGMVQIVCFGGNMLWRNMKVALRSAKGDTGPLATLNCNLLLNHALFRLAVRSYCQLKVNSSVPSVFNGFLDE